MLPQAYYVKRQGDKSKLIRRLKHFDFEQFFTMPKSSYIPVRFVYARFTILADTKPLGHIKYNQIPPELIRNKYVITIRSIGGKRPENCNSLCSFECISQFLKRKGVKVLNDGRTHSTTVQIFKKYCREMGLEPSIKRFPGVNCWEQMSVLERLCSVQINVYLYESVPKSKQHPNGFRATPLRLSERCDEQSPNGTCKMLRLEPSGHLLLLTDINRFLGLHCCTVCNWASDSDKHFRRHVNACTRRAQRHLNGPEVVFEEGRFYRPKPSLFEDIEHYCNVKLPVEQKTSFLMTFWDSETSFLRNEVPIPVGPQTTSIGVLETLVVGAISNVPPFHTHPQLFWFDDDIGDRFVKHLLNVGAAQKQILQVQMQPVFDLLNSKKEQAHRVGRHDSVKIFAHLQKRLQAFISRHLMLGFNSGKFDSHLVKSWLIPALVKHYNNKTSKIRCSMKDNRFVRIQCDDLILLDVINFLPSGGRSTYDEWVYTMLGKRLKSKFPYDYLTSRQVLRHDEQKFIFL